MQHNDRIIINRKKMTALLIFFLCVSAAAGLVIGGCKSISPIKWSWKSAGYGALAGVGIYISFLLIAYFILKCADCTHSIEGNKQNEEQSSLLNSSHQQLYYSSVNDNQHIPANIEKLYTQCGSLKINLLKAEADQVCTDFGAKKKSLTDGYIREMEANLSRTDEYEIFQNVPSAIKQIVFQHYNIKLEKTNLKRKEVFGMGGFIPLDEDEDDSMVRIKKQAEDNFTCKPKYAQSKYAVLDKNSLIKRRQVFIDDRTLSV